MLHPCYTTDLTGFNLIARSVVTFPFLRIEEVESGALTFLEAALWMDCWLFFTWAMFLKKCIGEAKCYSHIVAGTRMMVVVYHQFSGPAHF